VRVGLVVALVAAGRFGLESAGARYEARQRGVRLASLGGYQIAAAQPLPDLDSWQSSIEVASLAAQAPPGTRFAMSEHGLVGARAPSAILIDVLGLHDRAFARHGFSADELLLRRAPDAIWMPHPDHTQMIRDLLDRDAFWSHYDFYPDAFTYGFALRKESARSSILRALFESRWRASYPGLRPDDYLARRAPPPHRP
jgi:hypothetical protein